MSDLQVWQYISIALIFVWSGFVRAGIGFGGATLTMPFLLLVIDNPIFILPIIAVHLLFFACLALRSTFIRVDWRFLSKTLVVMFPFKIIGVIGLLSLPGDVLMGIVLVITLIYAIAYIFNFQLKSSNKFTDGCLLSIGAYISGTSLMGSPPIIAVYLRHVARYRFRETLFVLWMIMVTIKLIAFVITGTDLQLIHHLWLLPCAAVGHYFGNQMHERLLHMDSSVFMRVMGYVLLLVASIGLWNTFA